MSMSDIERAPFRQRISVRLKASPEAIFAQWAEPASWPTWFPLMHKAKWTSNLTQSVGAEREVSLLGLGRFHERMVAWEPGVRLTFTMIAGDSPLATQMSEDHRLTRNADGTTQFDYCVATVPTLLGKLANPTQRLIFNALIRRAAANLDRKLAR